MLEIGRLVPFTAMRVFCFYSVINSVCSHSSLAVCVQSLEVTVSQSSVQVARGQAVVLPCTFTTSAALNNLYIIWMVTPLANANQPEQVRHCFHMLLLTVHQSTIWVYIYHPSTALPIFGQFVMGMLLTINLGGGHS